MPSSVLTVRPVLPEEHAAVAELTTRVYVGEGFSNPEYEPALRDVTSRVESATVLVASVGPDLVGAVTVASRGGEWAEQAASGEAVIRMLVVSPQARGHGAGEALMRACLDRASQDGCTLVRLSSQTNMLAAHRLYERLGFARTPSYDWSPIPGLTLITYALPLAPWCGQCGRELAGERHERCRDGLEPPRYCAQCRRRMVVQVTPSGWSARCTEHGSIAGSTDS